MADCMNVKINVQNLDIFKDFVCVLNDLVDDERIPATIRAEYKRRVGDSVMRFEADHSPDWREIHEKHIRKHPLDTDEGWLCPNCKNHVYHEQQVMYCKHCGQLIIWKDV